MGGGQTSHGGRERGEKIKVLKVSSDVWHEKFSPYAHKISFEKKLRFEPRIDYALLAVDTYDQPAAYMTCRELDSESVYWQFGGSFKKDTHWSWRSYQTFSDWHKDRYAHISTLIENDNTVMLKMAMKVGFKIVGIRNFRGNILLEHYMEGKNGSHS